MYHAQLVVVFDFRGWLSRCVFQQDRVRKRGGALDLMRGRDAA